MLSNMLISNSMFPSFTTLSSQHSHLCYPHFLHVHFLMGLFYSIDDSWSNRFLIKFSLQSLLICANYKAFKKVGLHLPSNSYPMFDILLNLSNLLIMETKYWKESLCVFCWASILTGVNISLHMPSEVAIHIFSFYFKCFDLFQSSWILKPPTISHVHIHTISRFIHQHYHL